MYVYSGMRRCYDKQHGESLPSHKNGSVFMLVDWIKYDLNDISQDELQAGFVRGQMFVR